MNMYNEQIKERFLQQDKYRERTKRFFNISELVENELNKDLYDFSERDIDDLLISINSPSQNTLNIMLTVYRKYTDWAIQNNLVNDGINHYDFIHLKDLNKYINKFIANGKKISYDQFREMEKFTSNPFDRFVIQCLWRGIKGACMIEITLARLEDIDIENHLMSVYGIDESGQRLFNRLVPIDQNMISTAIEASNTFSEEIMNNIGLVNCPLKGDTIIKQRMRKDMDSNSAYNSYNRLYQRFRRTIQDFGLNKVNPVDFMMNGMVYQLQQLAQSENQDLFDILSSDAAREILKNFDMTYSNLPLKRRINQYV